jgi:hypothetical protein
MRPVRRLPADLVVNSATPHGGIKAWPSTAGAIAAALAAKLG